MTIITRIAKNSVMVILANISTIITSLILLPIIARYLGPNLFGDYAFVKNFTSFLLLLNFLGIQDIMIREIAKNKTIADKYLGNALLIRSLISSILILIIIPLIKFLNLSPLVVTAIYITVFAEIFAAYSILFVSIFKSFERMEYEALLGFSSNMLLLIIVIAVIYFDIGFLWLFIAAGVANLVQLLLGIYFCSNKFVRPMFQINFELWKYIIKEGIFLGIAFIFLQATLKIDVLIIKAFKGPEEVALFYAPHMLVLYIAIFATGFGSSVFPFLSRLANSPDLDKLKLFYKKALKFMLVLTLPISIFTTVFAHDIILIIFGEKFISAVISLQILIWTINFLFIDMFMGTIFISMGKQKYMAIIAFCGFALNLTLDLLLVPYYGYIGASVATLLSYFVLMSISYYFLSRELGLIQIGKISIKPFACMCFMGAVLYLLKAASFNIILALPIGILLYFISLFLIKTFSQDEMDMIKSIINYPKLISNKF